LGDYFSDDEEDDTWDEETLTSKSNLWSQTNFNNSEGNFQHLQSTLSEWDPVISGLETIGETRFDYPHPDFNNHDQTNSSTEAGNHTTTENNTIAAARLEFIQASNEALHAHLEEVLAKIEQNVQQNTDLSDKIAEE